eukprot:TRINITY_DN9265_c1_g2_i1.p1 TRINITY_DN9265_c1_g2~~TRINITY_DN9265_c1_g2_i1.p1  ORF type:complete len:423 (+),score=142.09 TRINITY_DN9265_c1_g2_i1:53-1270(+)
MTVKVNLHPDVCRDIEKFITSVKRRKSPYNLQEVTPNETGEITNLNVAKEAAEILRKVLSHVKGKDANIQVMIQQIREACRRMKAAYPYGPLISNVTRRVLYILRDEYQITKKEATPAEGSEGDEQPELKTGSFSAGAHVARTFNPALDSQLTSVPALHCGDDHRINFFQFKNNIMEHLTNNFMQDFDDVYKNIQKQAPEHIGEGEVILTYGYSQTVEKFLMFAAKKLKLTVVVCEAAPECNGHELAAKLTEQGIETLLIPDAMAYAYMARVNKVIIGTYLVVANGGLIAPAGTHGVAVAAQVHKVPVIVLSAMIKLTPTYPSTTDLNEFGRLRNPAEVLSFGDVSSASGGDCANWVSVLNASVDYVPPELIALFVTNDDVGRAYAPSYIYRLLLQLYNPEDSSL